MMNLKTARIFLLLALLAVPALLNAASTGQWNAGGFTQWHPNDGQTPMGTIGTQCFFCKPDPQSVAKEPANFVAPVAPAQPATPYQYGNSNTGKKKPAMAAVKKSSKKQAVAKKSGKKSATKKKSSKKQAVQQKSAQKQKQQQKRVNHNPGY
ncbi:MAG: hypothetical protein HQM06_11830 [Magnetococcales bacterium]|nr:hypothetical protein [Magnetococcales bacterium]